MKKLLARALLVSLPACAPMPVYRTALDHAYANYQTAKTITDLFFPFTTPARQAQFTKGEQVAEAAFAAARLSTDIATRNAELDKAQAATAVISESPPRRSSAGDPTL